MQALGVWAVACVRSVVPMFAAHQDTRTPVRASAANLVIFLALSALLMGPLDHVALAIANSVAAVVQLGLLLLWLRKHTGPLGLAGARHERFAHHGGLAGDGRRDDGTGRQFSWTEPARELLRAALLRRRGQRGCAHVPDRGPAFWRGRAGRPRARGAATHESGYMSR